MLSVEEVVLIVGGLCVRAMMSIHPHSGQGTPPMYGDFEAQRHWQEVTVNLPLKDWYRNTDQNNLTYWGLDYPPLTAYHSYLLGKVAMVLDPRSVELGTSHGYETPDHKMWMRTTVLLADLLVFIPAVLAFGRAIKKPLLALVFLMLYPGLIVIDGGHFQYNNVSLGLMIAAVAAAFKAKDCLASFLFVCALNYKQMELYHALPFFFYFLGKVWKIGQKTGLAAALLKLAKIGATVISTFLLIWAPIIFTQDLSGLDIGYTTQVLRRIFPVGRGLFEDKVANFWCSFNVIIKVKELYQLDQLVLMSLALTLITSMPTNFMLLIKPTNQNLLFALFNTSLAFFMFSFQVHEKTILLVAIPSLMLLTASDEFSMRRSSLASCWFTIISVFSMIPLLEREGLAVPTLCLTACFLLLCHYAKLLDPMTSSSVPLMKSSTRSPQPLTEDELKGHDFTWGDWMVWTLFNLSLMGCLLMGYASLHVPPPPRYPDLWPLLISCYSAAHFGLFAIYFHYYQLKYQMSGIKVDVKKKRN